MYVINEEARYIVTWKGTVPDHCIKLCVKTVHMYTIDITTWSIL